MNKTWKEEADFDLRVRSTTKEGKRRRIIQISYSPSPETDTRLHQALGILLGNEPNQKDEGQEEKT